MSIGVGAAAKGGPEMGFWPVAAYTLVYSNFDGITDLATVLALGFAGAVSYLILRAFWQIKEGADSRVSVRSNKKREGAYSTMGEKTKALAESTRALLPDSTVKTIIVVFAFLGNMAAGLILLLHLGWKIISTPEPQVTVVGLFVLPMLYILVLTTAKFW